MSKKEDRISEAVLHTIDGMAEITVTGLAQVAAVSGLPAEQSASIVLERYLLAVVSSAYASCPACALRALASKAAQDNSRCSVCASRTSGEYPLGLDWQ